MSQVQRLIDPLLVRYDMEEFREFVLSVARPSIELIPSSDRERVGCSKLSGIPDAPAGFIWPHGPEGPHQFLGQFDLSSLPDTQVGLPATGMLSVFLGYDTTRHSYPEYLRFAAHYFDDPLALKPAIPPTSANVKPAQVVQLQEGVDLPGSDWRAAHGVKWKLPEHAWDSYWDLRRALHPGRHFLFGYPFNTTLAYDPTPGPEWTSLFSFASVDEWEWWWGQGDWLVAFIRQEALASADFSEIRGDAG